jgi:hypothetical protein
VLEDCVGQPSLRGTGSSAHEASLRIIEEVFGYVSDSDSFIAAVER